MTCNHYLTIWEQVGFGYRVKYEPRLIRCRGTFGHSPSLQHLNGKNRW